MGVVVKAGSCFPVTDSYKPVTDARCPAELVRQKIEDFQLGI